MMGKIREYDILMKDKFEALPIYKIISEEKPVTELIKSVQNGEKLIGTIKLDELDRKDYKKFRFFVRTFEGKEDIFWEELYKEFPQLKEKFN